MSLTVPDFTVYATIFGLGIYHGVNPAMGWLFAVALGLQERSLRAVFIALIPIAFGHALSIALTVTVTLLAQKVLPLNILKTTIGAVLITVGILKLWRPRHFRWVGMKLTKSELMLWSFLAATAHGAGLMVSPLALCLPQGITRKSASLFNFPLGDLVPLSEAAFLAVAIHTIGLLGAMALTAWFVYAKLALTLLRQWWFNFDLVWGLALAAAGLVTMLHI